MRVRGRVRPALLAMVASLWTGCPWSAPDPTFVDTPLSPRALAGQRLFRQGAKVDGTPVSARVFGDVSMQGDQVACSSCHGRAGMGTREGGRITPAITGTILAQPDPRATRPAYDDALIIRAVRDGIGANGLPLDPLMPRYDLAMDDGAALLEYLHGLGAAPSPGVTDRALKLATIVADDVPQETRDGFLEMLNTHVSVHNSEMRNDRERSTVRRAPGQAVEPWRSWDLAVWDVTGPAETWGDQLEQAYGRDPVFLILSGVGAGSWASVEAFCERHAVPCLFPNTDRAPEVGADYYTLYFSGGLGLEARVIASELAEGVGPVVQLVRDGDEPARDAAATLARYLEAKGRTSTLVTLPGGSGSAAAARAALAGGGPAVGWLRADEVRALPSDLAAAPLFFSATLLDRDWTGVPSALAARARVVSPYRLPDERDPVLDRVRAWSNRRGIAMTAERVQIQTWFACTAFLDVTKDIGRYPQRDYVLDMLDHAASMTALIPYYSRPGFGPSQRYLSKGAYVVDLSAGAVPRWVVP